LYVANTVDGGHVASINATENSAGAVADRARTAASK
jgi:hypothetical protein